MMEQKKHEKFSSAKSALEAHLKTSYEGKLFKRNYGWAAAGLIFFFAALWVTAAAVIVASDSGSVWQIGVTLGAIAVTALLSFVIHGSSATGKCLLSLVGTVAVGVAVSFGLPVLTEALNSGLGWPLVLPALALPLVISCFLWISAPTKDGRAVLDHVAGFKQYLSITERERLDRMTAPADTPAIFEKYLPYAIALGVENHWANRFQSVLAAAA